jgi:hypothetical protein
MPHSLIKEQEKSNATEEAWKLWKLIAFNRWRKRLELLPVFRTERSWFARVLVKEQKKQYNRKKHENFESWELSPDGEKG